MNERDRRHRLCACAGAALLAAGVGGAAQAADTKDLAIGAGWVVVGRQHVRDGAEKDLAVLDADRALSQIRLCATEHAVRLRNATAWLPGGKRQKLWLPLVIQAGECSKPIDVQGAPQRVTHVALEYEALGAGWTGAHVVIAGQPAKQSR